MDTGFHLDHQHKRLVWEAPKWLFSETPSNTALTYSSEDQHFFFRDIHETFNWFGALRSIFRLVLIFADKNGYL